MTNSNSQGGGTVPDRDTHPLPEAFDRYAGWEVAGPAEFSEAVGRLKARRADGVISLCPPVAEGLEFEPDWRSIVVDDATGSVTATRVSAPAGAVDGAVRAMLPWPACFKIAMAGFRIRRPMARP